LIVSAEPRTVELYGLSFPVLNYQSTGGGQALVNIRGSDQLIIETRVASTVAREFFSNRTSFEVLPTDGVLVFIKKALIAHDVPSAMIAFQSIISFSDVSSPTVLNGVKELPLQDSNTVSFLKEALEYTLKGNAAPIFIARLITKIAEKDIPWVKDRYGSSVVTYNQAIRTLLRDDIYALIKDKDVLRARQLQIVQSELFGQDDPEVKTFHSLFVKLESLPETADYAITLTDIANQDESIKKYFGPLFNDAVLTKIEKLIISGDGEQGLLLLSQLDWSKRTPHIHQLTSESIRKLSFASSTVLQERVVKDYLSFISDKDPVIREDAISFLEAAIRFNKTDFHSSEIFFTLLSIIRPDPNSLNDQLRIEIVRDLYSQRDNKTAEQYLSQVSSFGIIDRVLISFSRIRGNLFKIVAFLGSCLTVLIASLLFRKWLVAQKAKKELLKAQQEETDEPQSRPVFVTARGVKGEHSGFPFEYVTAMHELGLPAAASLKDIKATFRNKMKDIHPDVINSGQGDNDQFIHFKETYERILAIRKDLGLDI
jgi:hypothetical protein